MEAVMGQMLVIRTDVDSPAGLRRRAKKEPNRRAALHMLAIANALEGMSRSYATSALPPLASLPPCVLPWVRTSRLVILHVSVAAMDVFLKQFAQTLPEKTHAVMVLDGAGWHDERALHIPANLILVPLSAYAPDLNQVERI
jgi:hypothetical protein